MQDCALLCGQSVGYSDIRLMGRLRIIRFQHVLSVLQASPGILFSRLAYECGYSDQSHLINEFKMKAQEFGVDVKSPTVLEWAEKYRPE